jgi:hypothetical protein
VQRVHPAFVYTVSHLPSMVTPSKLDPHVHTLCHCESWALELVQRVHPAFVYAVSIWCTSAPNVQVHQIYKYTKCTSTPDVVWCWPHVHAQPAGKMSVYRRCQSPCLGLPQDDLDMHCATCVSLFKRTVMYISARSVPVAPSACTGRCQSPDHAPCT